jgi:hypothetical protein
MLVLATYMAARSYLMAVEVVHFIYWTTDVVCLYGGIVIDVKSFIYQPNLI